MQWLWICSPAEFWNMRQSEHCESKVKSGWHGKWEERGSCGIQTSNTAQEQISSTPADWPRHMIS